MNDREKELELALRNLVRLAEAWIQGPLFRAGILWPDKNHQPPALMQARKVLGQEGETK